MPAERGCQMSGWGGPACRSFQTEEGNQGKCIILDHATTYNSIFAVREAFKKGKISPKTFILHMETHLEEDALSGCLKKDQVRAVVTQFIAEARGMLPSSPDSSSG